MIDTHPVIFIFIIHSAPIDNTFIIKDNVYDIVSVDKPHSSGAAVMRHAGMENI